MLRATRLLLAFARPTPGVREAELMIPADGTALPATLYRPRASRPAPAWVLLQGLTVYGRHHPSIQRFARALCRSGSVVLVPEIEAWTRLQMRSAPVVHAVAAAASFLHAAPAVIPGGIGVIGFSFGATQALVAATDPLVRPHLRALVGFGAYFELKRFARFMMTGEHEWNGTRYRLDPDPYARWIVAANFLTALPGLGRLTRVQRGVHRLAEEAGRGGLFQPDGYVDPLKAEIRAGLDADERAVWDLLAPPAGQPPPDLQAARELGEALALRAIAEEPLLDPRPQLPQLRARVVLAHGSDDRLIPFSETLRLFASLPPHLDASATITRLFQHSSSSGGLPPWLYAAEVWRLLRLFDRALRLR